MKIFRFCALQLFALLCLLPLAGHAQVKISDLPAGSSLTGTEIFPGAFGTCSGCTFGFTPVQISNFVQSNSGQLIRNQGQAYVAASGDTSGVADLANIQAAAASVVASARAFPTGGFAATAKIILGPGTFYLKQTTALLTGTSLQIGGFWLQGSGRAVTTIDYAPATPGHLFTNQVWDEVKMTDISFVGHDANSDFLWSQEQAGLSSANDYTFQDVDWIGSWSNIIRLTGGGNNNNWKFDRTNVFAAITNWIYAPPAIATTISSGSSTIGATNTSGQVQVGDTGSFSASVAPLAAGVQYYVVADTASTFQVSLTPGGSPVTFLANSTPTFSTSNDSFLNFWFRDIEFDTGTSPGQWINLNAGGSVKIRDSNIAGHAPSSVAYAFNLLNSAHAGGVMSFEVDGLRVEHAGNNSRLIHSQWGSGSISFNNLDESSQAGLRNITNQYANYELINAGGPMVTYTNSQLMGVHSYSNGVNNVLFQNNILYQQVTLLDNPTAANFIALTSSGNSGGLPRIRFKQCRNALNASTVGYKEVCDTDINWNRTFGGITETKQVSCSGTNGDWPISGGALTFRLPLNAMITRVRYWNPTGSSVGGAYQYVMQTSEVSPTILAGGPASPMAGSNASTPLAATAMYNVTGGNLPFQVTTDAQRTIVIQDTLTRPTGVFTGVQCLIDYIG